MTEKYPSNTDASGMPIHEKKSSKPRARRRNYAERCAKVTAYCNASIEMFDSIEKILQSDVSLEARKRLEHKKEAYQDILRILAGGTA